MFVGMRRKLASTVASIIIILVEVLSVASKIQIVKASGTIYIKADGSVDPPTANITSVDNVTYTFTENINDSIIVERSNIIIDGNGYTVQGKGVHQSKGIYSSGTSNVTIKNASIKNFHYGVHLNLTSRNVLSGNLITDNIGQGVWLYKSSNCTIHGNEVTNNGYHGFTLGHSDNNTVHSNNVAKNENGVSLFRSSNNTIHKNNITDNSRYGIKFWYTSSNTVHSNILANNSHGLYALSSLYDKVYGNNITNNAEYGVWLHWSSYCTFSENSLNGNRYNLYIYGYFAHSIDVSNTIEDEPIHYLINQKDLTINPSTYPEVGYLALINCTNMTVERLTLTNNGQGLVLAYTNNSRITRNNLSGNTHGLHLGKHSSDNTVYGNEVTNNGYGITLDWCSDNVIKGNNIRNNDRGINVDFAFRNNISENNITNNCYGLHFDISSNNAIYENNITSNGCGGVHLVSSNDNKFYHNNFINNTKEVTLLASLNFWDNSVEGNYWSNYTGVDSDDDGIGDTEHVIDGYNQDNFPLMGVFYSFNTSLGYHVNVVSNSTVANFYYFESNTTIRMYVSNITTDQTFGFCRISVPHALVNGTYYVTVNGIEPYYWNYTLHDDGDNRWIYFSYQHSLLEIVIISEFPSFLILPLFMIATLLAVILYRRKHTKHA